MERGNRIEAYVRRAGVAAGIALVAVLVLAFRVPDGPWTLGADVIMPISPTGELGLSNSGPFTRVPGLRPGGSLPRGTTLHKRTGKRLALHRRGPPASRDVAL